MTLSNFDWTDKESVKWFILLPTGHEGPYSFSKLLHLKDQKELAGEVNIWCEGLPAPLALKEAIKQSTQVVEVPAQEEELPPDLPDLPPIPQEEIPDLPPQDILRESEVEEIETQAPVLKSKSFKPWMFFTAVFVLMLFFVYGPLKKKLDVFEIRRLPKMTINLYERILQENSFGGHDKKIFFKEYLPDDHSHIWLVTTGFQKCNVEATFTSVPDKLLTMKDHSVAFKTKGKLEDHLVEFSTFDFTQGSKLIPGLYEMQVKASQCEWGSLTTKVLNRFSSPDKEYSATTKVVLFSKGAVEFNTVLERLVKKKLEIKLREENRTELFWQDLQQKLETLQAISLQIEQLLLEFMDGSTRTFNKRLKPTVDQYTRQFGSFLTNFVVENENYFKKLNPVVKGSAQKRNYELMVKLTAKKIGLESMKFIEEFQGLKKTPKRAELRKTSERLRNIFTEIKKDISQKIIQVSEDRSL